MNSTYKISAVELPHPQMPRACMLLRFKSNFEYASFVLSPTECGIQWKTLLQSRVKLISQSQSAVWLSFLRERSIMIAEDLRAKIISPHHEIFFARPGSGYRLMPSFIQNSAAIIDLPGLNLVNGVAFGEQPDLDAKILRSRAIRKWYQQGIDQPFPSKNLEDYANIVEDRTLSQLRSVINGYIDKAKIGDLVLTVPGGWNRDAVVGEFDTEGTEIETFEVPELYPRETLNGRSVKWLSSIRKNSLHEGIINIVHKPSAFVIIPRSLRRDIYALTYPGYIIGEECSTRFDVTSENYRSIDDLLLQAFFNFVAANTKAVSEGREGDVLSFADGAFVDAGRFNMDLRTEISSPGFLNLSSLSITPLVVAALFSLAVNVGPDAVQAAENGQIRIGNSLAPADDRCVADVNEKAIRQLRLLGLDRWSVACEKARRASQNTGVNGPARVRQ